MQNEAIVRQILVGEAGQRIQGGVVKLGIDRSYVMINTLYSVYGNVPTKIKKSAAIADYPDFLDRIASQKNLPGYVKTGLQTLY